MYLLGKDAPRPLTFGALVAELDAICDRGVNVRASGDATPSFLESSGVLARGFSIRFPSGARFATYLVGSAATLALSESSVIGATKTGAVLEIDLRGGASIEVSTDEGDVLGLVSAGVGTERG
jgi:hypothetical protein